MKKTTFLLAALLSLSPACALAENIPGSNPLTALTAPINISTTVTTKLVTADSRAWISTYITAWSVMAGGIGTFQWEYGSGTLCATGTVVLSGAYPLVANVEVSMGTGNGALFVVPPGNDVCVATVGAVQYSGYASYAKF